jgi:hypothetical protein
MISHIKRKAIAAVPVFATESALSRTLPHVNYELPLQLTVDNDLTS